MGDDALPGKLDTSVSETTRLVALFGSTPESGVPKVMFSSGLAANRSTAITGSAVSAGRRMTTPANRPHHADELPGSRRIHGRRPALTRRPSTASSAGATT